MNVTIIADNGERVTMTDAQAMFVEDDPGDIVLAAAVKEGKLEIGASYERIVEVLTDVTGVVWDRT